MSQIAESTFNHERNDESFAHPFDLIQVSNRELRDGMTLAALKTVPEDKASEIWDFIQNGFVALNQESLEKQDMTREEFLEDIENENVLKYVVSDESGRPVGYMTVLWGLDRVVWADQSMLKNRQDTIDRNARSFYIGTIAVPTDMRAMGIAQAMLRSSYEDLKKYNELSNHESLVFFDCAEANMPGIPLIAERSARTKINSMSNPIDISITEIATDVWYSDGGQLIKTRLESLPDGYKVLDKKHTFELRIVQ